MADWARRAERALRRELRPGEVVLAAVLVDRHHATVDDAGDPEGEDATTSRPSMAAAIDPRTRFLVLTDQRLIVTGSRGWPRRPATILGLFPPHDLRQLDVERAEDGHRLIARFADGSARRLSAPLRQADPRALDRELARRIGSELSL